jgi:polar amino acid transport system substrate-binding protein
MATGGTLTAVKRLAAGMRPALLALAILAPGALLAAPCSRSVTAAAGDFPPYVYQDGMQQWAGVDVEMAQAIFREAGCPLAFSPPMPATRYLELFKVGKVDLILGASDTAERRAYAVFSSAYREEVVSLFALADVAARYANVKDFAAIGVGGLTLLAPKAGYYGAQYARHLPRLRASGGVSEFVNFAQGVRMLAARRASLIMGDSAAVQYEASRQGLALQALPLKVLRAPVHLMFSKDALAGGELEQINAAIERLDRNGTLRTIARSYGAQ